MWSARVKRGFHRLGLFVAVPLAAGAMVALITAGGLLIAPGIVGPVFGFEDTDSARIMRNVEKIAAEGATDDEIASYAATERVALTKPDGVELKLTNTGPAPSLNRFAKFTSRAGTKPAKLPSWPL